MYLVCVTFLLRPLVSDTNPLGKVHICGHWSYNGRCFRTRSGLSWFLFDPWSPVPTDYGRYPFADIGPIMDVVSRQELDSFINFQGSEALVCGYIAVQGRRLCDTINLYIFRVCVCFFLPNESYDCIHVDIIIIKTITLHYTSMWDNDKTTFRKI